MSAIEMIQRNMFAAVAALSLTATSVGAAVGPARAVETAPLKVAAHVVDQAQA